MTTATDLLKEPVAKAQPAVAAKVKARLTYLDTLRAIMIILVIALHTAITYGASGSWLFEDPNQTELSEILLTLVPGLVQAFSMGLFFFLSGYFTPGPYDRKGILVFWKDRLLRLAIPMLLFSAVLSSVTYYFAGTGSGEDLGSFWSYFPKYFLDTENYYGGPAWFLCALLLFALGYTIWRLATRAVPAEKMTWIKRLEVPSKKQILLFGLAVGVLMLMVGLRYRVGDEVEIFGTYPFMVIYFVQYILFFIVGMLAYRNDWLARFESKDKRFWGWISLGLALALPVALGVAIATGSSPDSFAGGLGWEAIFYMLWVGIFSVSISMFLILWLRDRPKQGSRLELFAGSNYYAVYLLHPMILVPIAVAMVAVPLDPNLKWVIVTAVVSVICFVISDLLRRIPGVKSIL